MRRCTVVSRAPMKIVAKIQVGLLALTSACSASSVPSPTDRMQMSPASTVPVQMPGGVLGAGGRQAPASVGGAGGSSALPTVATGGAGPTSSTGGLGQSGSMSERPADANNWVGLGGDVT